MARYPHKTEIKQLASSLETSDPSPFFDRVSPDVVWDVMGTHPAAGRFTSLKSWKEDALGVVNGFLSEPLKLKVVNVIGGGDQEWAVLELEAHATCKNGAQSQSLGVLIAAAAMLNASGMPYEQRYAWALKFDEKGIVVEAKAYLDSALVQQCYDANVKS